MRSTTRSRALHSARKWSATPRYPPPPRPPGATSSATSRRWRRSAPLVGSTHCRRRSRAPTTPTRWWRSPISRTWRARRRRRCNSQALAAYDAHLALEPDNLGALRMRAETQLRLRDYAGAFGTFGRLRGVAAAAAVRVARGRAVSAGARRRVHRDDGCGDRGRRRTKAATDKVGDRARLAVLAAARARDWRQLAAELGGGGGAAHLRRLRVGELSAAQRALLGEEYGRQLVPPPPFAPITALRARDWAAVESNTSKRVVVIDGLLDSRRSPSCNGTRGTAPTSARCAPATSARSPPTAPPTRCSSPSCMAAAAPSVSARTRWRSGGSSSTIPRPTPRGSGSTPTPPPSTSAFGSPTTPRASTAAASPSTLTCRRSSKRRRASATSLRARPRSALRGDKAESDIVTVPYACNRAVVFVSDQYHESLPFGRAGLRQPPLQPDAPLWRPVERHGGGGAGGRRGGRRWLGRLLLICCS